MTSVLFVCLGNICRSPMAEGVFNRILQRENAETFRVDSAGLLDYHQGEPADNRMRTHAQRRGYMLTHRSRPVTREDFEMFDIIIGMDNQNIRGLNSIARTDAHKAKIKRITDYCSKYNVSEVPDPYYGGADGFEFVIDLLEDACENLYKKIS